MRFCLRRVSMRKNFGEASMLHSVASFFGIVLHAYFRLGTLLEKSMFTHVMIGSKDLEQARGFYDATFAALGGNPGEMDARGRPIYAHEGRRCADTDYYSSFVQMAATG